MAKVKAMTQEWMDAYKAAIQADPEYRTIAKDWEGSVALICNADPSKGVPEPIYLFQDYWHGDVGEFVVCDKAKAESAKFVMTGDYSRWKQVALKELDATKALLQGKLKMKGDLPYVVRNIKTVNKVIDILGAFETQWPDDPA
ncbi:MAG TPA: SCP2 sterol-binding domain-containing protein [Deltaproteobacteria bacterium]|nr:SCP2 sterol-binding domain-containing protein [Deltaproteobacteria bacterium]HPI92406.1 SCP2 sterol-binding domain-containing protein [Deltaproteobacteria bacterium]HPR55051.1 SCP2 sterol-binding domain-containing protein [Deltaproteobacteria bacterium]HXK47888.1 SCP2 sterol-binding domain-containing protein [Deltaproteobacteria bacterium]